MPQYRNREIKERKWGEIGAVFNLSGTDAYKKFVALREKYKREQKLRDSKTITETECWRLYDKMKFLDTVSFSRDRRWSKPKYMNKRQHQFPHSSAFMRQDLSPLLIKNEFPELQMVSVPTSPSYQMSGDPSENGSCEAYQDNSDYYNDSTMQEAQQEDPDGSEFGVKMEQMPDIHPVASTSSSSVQHHQQQFLERLESKTNAILADHNKRQGSWERCETLGHRVAQTMHTLEEHDPDLALKFDIMLSEAITSIKKDQLERLMTRQQQTRDDDEQEKQAQTIRLEHHYMPEGCGNK